MPAGKSLQLKFYERKISRLFLAFFVCLWAQSADSQIPQKDRLTLELGKPVEHRIADAAERQNYELRLGENQFAKIIVDQAEADVKAELFGADGNYVTAFNGEIRLGENEKIEFVAPKAGIYRLEIRPAFKKTRGRYEISLAETRPAAERDVSVFEAYKLFQKAVELDDSTKSAAALTFAVSALELAEKELGTDNSFVGLILHQLGDIQMDVGNYSTALNLLQRSIAINEKTLGKEHPQTVEANYSLGLYYRRIGDLPKAERIQRRNLEIYERTLGVEHPKVAVALNGLGVILNDLNDHVAAEILFQRAIKIVEQNLEADHQLLGYIFNNLGVLYLIHRKDYDRAEQYLQRGLEIHAKTSGTETAEYSNRLQNLGIVYRNRKQYAKALEFYERALVIREKNLGKEHQNIAYLLNNIANIYKAKGDYEKALEIQGRVRDIAEKSVGPYHALTVTSIGNTVTIYAAKADYANAAAYQKLFDERFEKVIALDLTTGSERQKLAYAEVFPSRTSRAVSLHLNPAGNNQTAVDLAALAILRRKGRVLDAVAANFSALRERADAGDRALLDQLNKITAQLGKLTLNKPAKITLDEYRSQLADLEAQKEKIEREISNRSAEFAVQTPAVTLEAVKAEIPPDAALVEFAVFRPFDPKAENNDEAYAAPHCVVYVIRREGEIRWKDLGETKSIEQAVGEWRKALRDPQRKDVTTLARAVDAQIMQPVRAMLGDARKLLISPDGDLNLIPFAALVDETGKYLIENYSFDYLSSGRDLLRLKISRPAKNQIAVIANPAFSAVQESVKPSVTATRDMSDTYFASLPATMREAQSIQKIFPDAVIYSETKATETALKELSAPGVLHIASHGFFLENPGEKSSEANVQNRSSTAGIESGNPLLRSGIALAGANQRKENKEDGVLTALEASGLNLWGTKLVVLSACDTGLGEVKNGEGVYGLRRAFVLAGTETLMMSLWSVSDYATRELMTNYYKNLRQGMGRGASLRQVQLEMLKRRERAHPFYWAGFIQSGEWANLDGKR